MDDGEQCESTSHREREKDERNVLSLKEDLIVLFKSSVNCNIVSSAYILLDRILCVQTLNLVRWNFLLFLFTILLNIRSKYCARVEKKDNPNRFVCPFESNTFTLLSFSVESFANKDKRLTTSSSSSSSRFFLSGRKNENIVRTSIIVVATISCY